MTNSTNVIRMSKTQEQLLAALLAIKAEYFGREGK